MAYCHECGEQVAENDAFCPFCGITLQPIAVAGLEDDDSFSKTIVVQQPPKTAQKTAVSADETQTAQDSAASLKADEPPIRERLGVDDSISDNSDFTADDENLKSELPLDAPVSEEFSVKVEDESKLSGADQSIPAFHQNDEINAVGSENLDAPDEENQSPEINYEANYFNADSTENKLFDENNLKSESENTLDQTSENETPAIPQTESSMMSYEEAEVKEILSPEETENSFGENFVASSSSASQPNQVDLGVFHINEDASAFSSQDESVSPVVEKPIAMPDAELPVEENCPPSRFDSVSIMEKPEQIKESPSAFSSGGFAPGESKPADASAADGKSAEQKESRSYTKQNIGNGDTGGKSKAKLKPLDEGTVLNGRYEVIRKIGGGGMGAVYLASDKNLGGVLRAVKEMVQSYIENDQQVKAVNDFKRESLLLTSLDHQSIPTIYDYFFDETEARFYLVMKYISGGDLAGKLRSTPEGRIDETSVTQWAIQIADVLDYLHNRQPPIVYRDLKPANIMIDGNSGRVMLIDFGIARWVNKEEKGVTAVGTMGYAPPELFSGNVESRSDIYSLGSTMFHLLTGADPQSNPLLIFDFQKHPRPRQINPQLSDQMERILMRAVEYNADKRFASAAEMRKALEDHLENMKAGRITFGVKAVPESVPLSDQPVFCGFCGQKIVATDMFCAFCGAKQPLAQQGIHASGYSPSALTAQLLIIGTNELEQPAFRLEKEDNLVGRRDPQSNIFPEVDLSKFDPQTKISRRHARIWREGNEYMVEDLGSSNGTYLLPIVSDTMRLQPHQPQLLTNGDKLRLGDTTLHFVLG